MAGGDLSTGVIAPPATEKSLVLQLIQQRVVDELFRRAVPKVGVLLDVEEKRVAPIGHDLFCLK